MWTDGHLRPTLLGRLRKVDLKYRMAEKTSLGCHRQIHVTCCVRPIALYSKVNARCDKLATDDHHQFISASDSSMLEFVRYTNFVIIIITIIIILSDHQS